MERHRWDIDVRLAALVGSPVRVRAEQLWPRGWDGKLMCTPIAGRNLILTDGSAAGGDPIYVEGVLNRCERTIAVVSAELT